MRLAMIKGSYYRDILDQPAALAATLDGLKISPALAELASALAGGAFRNLVLTGMGSSYFGLLPLQLRLAEHGLAPALLETSELIHYGRGLLAPGTLVVAMSQSGSSAETLRLLDLNQGRATILAVTNTAGSPLEVRSTARVLTRAGVEHSVSCKTYLAALAAQHWLGEVLCGQDPGPALAELAQGPARVQAFLADLEPRVEALALNFKDSHSLFLVGRGPSLASAGTGALIIKEAAHFHAEGMSSAAFRHGPLEMIHPDLQVLVFAGDAATRPLNEGLLADIQGHGGQASLCDVEPAPKGLRQILEILQVQAITLALAALAGKEAGAFRWATKITTTE